MADLSEVIGLLHLADWTRLSLSAEVRFESGGRALLIAPGGHYRMEHQDEDGVVQGNDGQRGWTWWPSGRSEPSPAEVGLDDGRPVAVLFCPQDLLDGYVLEILGPVTACGRAAIAIAATPRAGDRLHEHVEAAVDAELGILLRREERFRGQLLAVTELTDVTMNPPAAAAVGDVPGAGQPAAEQPARVDQVRSLCPQRRGRAGQGPVREDPPVALAVAGVHLQAAPVGAAQVAGFAGAVEQVQQIVGR